jgi:hypothetical protein
VAESLPTVCNALCSINGTAEEKNHLFKLNILSEKNGNSSKYSQIHMTLVIFH